MKLLHLLIYAIFSVGGVVFIKLSGSESYQLSVSKTSLLFEINWMLLVGMVLYVVSFLIYIGLISKNQLTYVVPMATAVVYILTLVSSYVIFKEHLNIYQIAGCAMIIVGALLIGKK